MESQTDKLKLENEIELNDLSSLPLYYNDSEAQLQVAFDEMVTTDQNHRLSESSNKYNFDFEQNIPIRAVPFTNKNEFVLRKNNINGNNYVSHPNKILNNHRQIPQSNYKNT